jgi:two-component system phosphate regulon sensor histidine kinase PhoR
LIQKGYVPREEQASFLAQTERRAGELLTTLDDLLLLSRLKEKTGSTKAESVSVADILDSALAAFQKDVQERCLTIQVENPDHPILWGAREDIQALWTHLLSNAIRYTPPGGRITISLREDSRERKIIGTVSDTGIGISAEEIPRIFEEFYRTKEARAMQETGTGLGLPIVQQIVSLYGGAVEIDSAKGRGSSFRFILSPSALLTGEAP